MTTGLQSAGQIVITASTTLSATQAGYNSLITGAGITLTFPNTSESFALSNIGTDLVTLAFPAGSDFGTVLYPDQQVILAGDGGGYWRVVSQSLHPKKTGMVAASRSELAALPAYIDYAAFLSENGREGMFKCVAGTQPVTDALQGLYIPSNRSGYYWERVRESDMGRPEWFGAVPNNPASDCLPALEACTALCQTTSLDAVDYYVHDMFQFAYSGKVLEGAAGTGTNWGLGYVSDETGTPGGATTVGEAGGTRVILTGENVVAATVFQFGSSSGAFDDDSITRNSFVRNIKFARDCSVYKPRPSLTADPINCVKGVIMSFISTSGMYNVKSFDSPVGFHCFGVVNSTLDECNCRRMTAASSSTNDFYVGFLVGGYGGANYGYIGANASIYLRHCTVFDQNPAFDKSIGLKLFGYTADTFIYDFEMARLDYGIVIDGSDAFGVTLPNSAAAAHQDVTIDRAIIDGAKFTGIEIRNLNDWNSLVITNPYVATQEGGTAISLTDVAGRTVLSDGKIVAADTGVAVTNVNGFRLNGTIIRECAAPVVFNNCGMFDAEPVIFTLGKSVANAVTLNDCFRGYIRPHVDGAPGSIGYGVSLNSGSIHTHVDGSVINPGAMVSVSAARKVRFNGADASTGAGATAFAANANVLSGVIS